MTLGFGASVAGRGRRDATRAGGPGAAGLRAGGDVMQINSSEHLPGAGTACAQLSPELQLPRAGSLEARRRRVFVLNVHRARRGWPVG